MAPSGDLVAEWTSIWYPCNTTSTQRYLEKVGFKDYYLPPVSVTNTLLNKYLPLRDGLASAGLNFS